MALLERINSMKQRGLNETQIQNLLIEEGLTPREINEAFSQSKIKEAVTKESEMQHSILAIETGQQFVPGPEVAPTTPSQGTPQQAQRASQQVQMPAQQQYINQQEPYSQEQYAQEGYDPNASYDPNAYAQQGYYPQVLDIETVRDISKQQVEEALKKLKEEILTLSKLKSEIKFEIQDIENRLAKVEEIIHEIQSSILRKMGEYGESIQGISKEIRATQDSFAKVINPLFDKKRGIYSKQELQENESAQEQQVSNSEKGPKSRNDNSASFEDYFR